MKVLREKLNSNKTKYKSLKVKINQSLMKRLITYKRKIKVLKRRLNNNKKKYKNLKTRLNLYNNLGQIEIIILLI